MLTADKEPLSETNRGEREPAPPSIGALLRKTFEKWYIDNIPRHAAALAFYTLFAIAPLLLLAVEVMSLLYGRTVAEEQLTAQIEQYVHNAEAAALTQTILNNALPSSANWIVTVGIVIALLYGASSVFGELQIMLNIIWGVHYGQSGNIRRVVRQRIIAIIMVILSGLLIVLGLLLTLWYSEATNWAGSYLNTSSRTDQFAYFIITLGLTALVFALIYKFVPDVDISWHDVLIGALATAFLVSLARLVITLYMSYNRIGSIYGAAGSLVILLLWVYYSAQIFFLGAEFTQVYSKIYGTQRGKESPNLATIEQPPLIIKAETQEKPPIAIEVVNLKEGEPTEDEKRTHNQRKAVQSDTFGQDDDTAPKHGAFGLPQLPRPHLSLPHKLPTVNLPTPSLSAMRSNVRAIGNRLKRIVTWPLRLMRPIREIFTAVGVIGALSLAALFGFPWGRRLAQQSKETQKRDSIDKPETETSKSAQENPVQLTESEDHP